jgi:hypothetical protein
MGIASQEQKQQVIEALKNSNKKYAKPFEQGKMALASVFGGNWEEYATVVIDMVSADTLLDINAQLTELNATMKELLTVLNRTDGSAGLG